MTERICEFLRAGNFVNVTCDLVGIDQSTYYKWAKRGEEEIERIERGEEPSEREAIFVKFVEATTRAKAEAVAESVKHIRAASIDDWRAAAWYLEHGHQKLYGNRSIDVTSGGEPVKGVIVLPDNGRGQDS